MSSWSCLVAGTTERILQSKEDLFDAFVLDGSLTCRTVYNEPLLRLTRQDQARFRHLSELHSGELARSSVTGAGASDGGEGASEDSFVRWVTHAIAAHHHHTGQHLWVIFPLQLLCGTEPQSVFPYGSSGPVKGPSPDSRAHCRCGVGSGRRPALSCQLGPPARL